MPVPSWVSVRYMHEGQEPPDQPDNSWDPGDFFWGLPPGWGLPAGWTNWGGLGAAECPCGPYLNPGDTYIQEPINGSFYPGEWDRTGGIYPWSFEDGAWTEGDGSHATVASGSEFIAGGYPFYYYKFAPRPTITQGVWRIKVRGTGTVRFSLGLDLGSMWDWYYGTTTGIAWVLGSTQDVNSETFIEGWVSIPPAMFTNIEDDTHLLRVEVLSGSLDFDYVGFNLASDCGYHDRSGTVYSAWLPVEEWTKRTEPTSPGASTITQPRLRSIPLVAYSSTAPDVTVDLGMMYEAPVVDIRTPTDLMLAEIPGTTYSGPVTVYPTYTGNRYESRPVGTLSSQVVGEYGGPQWIFTSYYPGLGGIPPHNASWEYQDGAAWRTFKMFGHSIAYDPTLVSKPAWPAGMNAVSMMKDIHYSGTAVQYETANPEFVKWSWANYTVPPESVNESQRWSVSGMDSNPSTPGLTFPDISINLRKLTLWEIGDPWPSPTDGTDLFTFTFSPSESVPSIVDETQYLTGDITDPSFTIFTWMTGYSNQGGWHARLDLTVLLPRYRYAIPQWTYKGGARC